MPHCLPVRQHFVNSACMSLSTGLCSLAWRRAKSSDGAWSDSCWPQMTSLWYHPYLISLAPNNLLMQWSVEVSESDGGGQRDRHRMKVPKSPPRGKNKETRLWCVALHLSPPLLSPPPPLIITAYKQPSSHMAFWNRDRHTGSVHRAGTFYLCKCPLLTHSIVLQSKRTCEKKKKRKKRECESVCACVCETHSALVMRHQNECSGPLTSWAQISPCLTLLWLASLRTNGTHVLDKWMIINGRFYSPWLSGG